MTAFECLIGAIACYGLTIYCVSVGGDYSTITAVILFVIGTVFALNVIDEFRAIQPRRR